MASDFNSAITPIDTGQVPGEIYGGMISSPALDEKGKPTQRSIKDADQAARIIKAMQAQNRYRMLINGRIVAKYNAERPYRQQELEEEGLGWKSNFSTKPLANIIERVTPRFVEAVQGLKYLTNAALPETTPGAQAKTEAFRRIITETVRAWRGWRHFLEDIAVENTLFGWTVVGWLDEYTWKPHCFRTDEILIPRGTKQSVDSAQLVVLKEVLLPHELFAYIKDKQAAEMAGWNIENTIKAINQAAPPSLRGDYVNWPRLYEDYLRDLSLGTSFEEGAKVVTCWNVLALEVTGKVSHYRMADIQGNFIPIFVKEDRFNSMADCVAFFAYQKGNGTLHGSKGIGREVYELTSVIDRVRNEIVDRLNLSGKILVQGDPANLKRYRMAVVGNTILINSGVNVLEQKIDPGVEGFLKLDDYLSLLLDQLTGATSPRVLKGERVTKAQVELFAEREEETKDAKISRFLCQFADMMLTIQKRLCDPETIEEDAKEMQKRLLKIMSREELKQLAEQPTISTVADFTPVQRQQIAVIATENAGNPLYNARKLEEYKLTALVNAEFAKDVLRPENDPVEIPEQIRQQLVEFTALEEGRPLPVSARDNHAIHLETILNIGPTLVSDSEDEKPELFAKIVEALQHHTSEHINFYLNTGGQASDEIVKNAKSFIKSLEQAKAAAQKASAEAPASAPPEGAVPPEAAGLPPEAAGLPPEAAGLPPDIAGASPEELMQAIPPELAQAAVASALQGGPPPAGFPPVAPAQPPSYV